MCLTAVEVDLIRGVNEWVRRRGQWSRLGGGSSRRLSGYGNDCLIGDKASYATSTRGCMVRGGWKIDDYVLGLTPMVFRSQDRGYGGKCIFCGITKPLSHSLPLFLFLASSLSAPLSHFRGWLGAESVRLCCLNLMNYSSDPIRSYFLPNTAQPTPTTPLLMYESQKGKIKQRNNRMIKGCFILNKRDLLIQNLELICFSDISKHCKSCCCFWKYLVINYFQRHLFQSPICFKGNNRSYKKAHSTLVKNDRT